MRTNFLRRTLMAVVIGLAMLWCLAGNAAAASSGPPCAWGDNTYGELGDNTNTLRTEPIQVHNLTGVVAIAAGFAASLALKSDGTVWAWGLNDQGQLGDNTTTGRSEPVQVHNLTGVAAIAAFGECHSLALKGDGTVWAWGDNQFGQLGDNTTTDRHEPVQVHNLAGVVAIGAGDWHSLAVKGDGTVWSFGDNDYGQLGGGGKPDAVPHPLPIRVWNLTGVVAVAGGLYHSLALKSDGTVWAWGDNKHGQLGDNSTTTSTLPVRVHNLTGVVAIAGGNGSSKALKSDGTVWAWGWNDNGQLGDNSTMERWEPVQVHNLTGVVAIAGGWAHTLAVKSDGTIWAWGANSGGELGDNTRTNRYEPVQVHLVTGAWAVAGGVSHSLALAKALPTFSISGFVKTSAGTGVASVTMGGLPGNPVTAANGGYTGTVGNGWSGTVTPTKAGYTFSPASKAYTSVTANQTQDFTATVLTFAVSGSVKTSGGAGIAGVTLGGLPGSPTTAANGSYTGTVDYGWSGTVTPMKAGYTFSPASKAYTSVTANQAQDYVGTKQPPMLDVQSSGDVDFGNVGLGVQKIIPTAYTIKNTGWGTLHAKVSIGDPPFQVLDDKGVPVYVADFALLSGQVKKVSLSCVPYVLGPMSRTITFSGDGNSVTTIRTAKCVGVIQTKIATCPTSALKGSTVVVVWNVEGGKPTHNDIHWATSLTALARTPNKTAQFLKPPYSTWFRAPATAGTVYVQAHAIITGKTYFSDVKQIIVR